MVGVGTLGTVGMGAAQRVALHAVTQLRSPVVPRGTSPLEYMHICAYRHMSWARQGRIGETGELATPVCWHRLCSDCWRSFGSDLRSAGIGEGRLASVDPLGLVRRGRG